VSEATPRRARPSTDAPGGSRRLRFSSDRDPGYGRRGGGKRTWYVDDAGKRLKDRAEIERIRSLAIPPAWTDVWICTDARGHLQAVGRDARGRKQYRYHPEWRRQRDADKYERMERLARRLPRIREAVERDLSRPGLPREKVLALVVRLLELTHLRVGGEAYRRLNRSYGLTTMRSRQATVSGSHIRFRFKGKGGKLLDVGIRDRRLARLIRRVQDLPGQRLFEYTDDAGKRHAIDSEDVNEYIRAISGTDVTAKDFRTWAGTLTAFRALRQEPPSERESVRRRRAKRALTRAANALGNTPDVTRASYVDPDLLDAWEEGELERLRLPDPELPMGRPGEVASPREEEALLRLLKRRRS
jgi:DNA topoisomerase-1